MPSAVDRYHAAKITEEAAAAEVKALLGKLNAVVKALTLNPLDVLPPPRSSIRYPVEDDPGKERMRIDSEDMAQDNGALEEMPSADMIRLAVMKLGKAEGETKKAFEALSVIEKSYVSSASRRQP